MPQCFSAPALSGKEVLAYGDSLTGGFYMAGQRFSPYGEALSRELGDVDVCVWLERTDGRAVIRGRGCSAHRGCGMQTRPGAWLGS